MYASPRLIVRAATEAVMPESRPGGARSCLVRRRSAADAVTSRLRLPSSGAESRSSEPRSVDVQAMSLLITA